MIALTGFFFEKSLLKWGFAPAWVSIIMECVTSVKYLVKFNVKLLEQFSPSRGPRQGDPLSPFLFLFVADAFFALLNKSMVDNVLEPVVLCWNAPEISLLLFADDSLLFLGRLC